MAGHKDLRHNLIRVILSYQTGPCLAGIGPVSVLGTDVNMRSSRSRSTRGNLYRVRGRHECEVLGPGPEAAESGAAWQNCEKNPGHGKFIPVADFMNHRLLRSLRDDQRDWLKLTIDLTVRLRVNWTSADRPDDDGLAEHRGTGTPRLGTGFIWDVKVSQENILCPCPCGECCGRTARKFWTFYVNTAKHVVFNTEEARETRVDLFYDNESSDVDGRMESLWAFRVPWSLPGRDDSMMECVTCDERLGRRLETLHLRRQVLPESRDPVASNPSSCGIVNLLRERFLRRRCDVALVISHPHGQPKKITVGKALFDMSWSDIDANGYLEYLTATCPGSSGAPVLPFHSPPMACHYLWTFVHSGTIDKPSAIFRNRVNYGMNRFL